jgi:Ca2+-transporting ATPase
VVKTVAEASPHASDVDAVVRRFESDATEGLTPAEAAERLARYGPNSLPEAAGRSLIAAVVSQFTSFLILLLLAATIVAAAIGEIVDAATIAAIVALSAALGFVQEWRAEQAISALRAMTAPEARLIRRGAVTTVPAGEVVPGDIVVLDVGNYVPADLRLIESHMLQIDEASLTGESVPVRKSAEEVLPQQTEVADRQNSAFAGTIVTYGRGAGLAVATGEATEIGRIAQLIARPQLGPTPLQRRMSELGRYLGAAAIAVSAIVFAAGVLRGLDLFEIGLAAISLAVAAVPEGLAAVVVISLALGMQRMARRNALVRRLAAVETLGSATVIASDKTGTLTRGEMTVTALYTGPGRPAIEVTGSGYEPAGDFRSDDVLVDPATDGHLELLLTAGALCNDASLEQRDGRWQVIGDTTEGALVVAARKAGLDWERVESSQARTHELPFTSERALMTTVHRFEDRAIAYMKGAPEVVLARCLRRRDGDAVVPLTEADERDILHDNRQFAANGLRVLGLAYRIVPREPDLDNLESEMVFLGLAAMRDPPREEAREAVAACRGAGIRAVMITGDHGATAVAIARDLHLADDLSDVLTGAQLDDMSDEDLRDAAKRTSVYARISAAQKVRIVEAMQAAGEIVAVTGDGVNDAPALHRADIGVAMGITGTDVAKEAADMVITDDNFASIVAAVEEGRHIFDNIRNFVVYLLGGNIGEIAVVFVGVISGLPLPLLPIQILFVNLVTDGPPALALGVEPGDPGALKRPPRDPRESLIARRIWLAVAVRGALLGAATLAVYVLWWEFLDRPEGESRTIAFSTLVVSQVLFAFTSRSLHRTVLELGLFTNAWLVAGCSASLLSLVAVLYAPGLTDAFETEALGIIDWLVVSAFAVAPVVLIEAGKVSRWRLGP